MAYYCMATHEVKDFDKWKIAFDNNDSMRREYGENGTPWVFRNDKDSHKVSILIPFKDTERAKEMMKSKELKKTLKEVGVIGKPSFSCWEKV